MWNVTLSEIMVIEKGSKHELTYNPSLEKSRSPSFKENLLTFQMKRHFSNKKLNSIVNVYKFKKVAPYKIYDNNNTLDNNFHDFMDNKVPPRYFNKLFNLFDDFYKWKKKKMKNFTYSQLKKDVYIIETINNYQLNPNLIIFLLLVFIFILTIFTIKTYIKKQFLKNELSRRNKSEYISNDSSSTDNTSKEKGDIKEEDINSLVNTKGYIEKRNLEGNYDEEPNIEENPLPSDELNSGLNTIGNIFLYNNTKPEINYWENADKTEFTKTEMSIFIIDKKKIKVKYK